MTNQALIAEARGWANVGSAHGILLSKLADALEAAEAKLAKAREALEFYAKFRPDQIAPTGAHARATLKEIDDAT